MCCSEADPKGSDCYEKFSEMQTCMAGYPELYGKDDDDDVPLPPAGGEPPAGGAPPAGGPPAEDQPGEP